MHDMSDHQEDEEAEANDGGDDDDFVSGSLFILL